MDDLGRVWRKLSDFPKAASGGPRASFLPGSYENRTMEQYRPEKSYSIKNRLTAPKFHLFDLEIMAFQEVLQRSRTEPKNVIWTGSAIAFNQTMEKPLDIN